jgi:hypothetical protein
MNLSIENEKGSTRSGVGKDGKKWSVAMPAHYGYIKGTTGADGDHVDAYLGPHPGHPTVHVVDQVDADTGKFDEHKALIGFKSRKHALDHYHRGFSDGRGKDRVGAVTSLPAHKFRSWLEKGRRTRPLGALRINRTHTDPYLAGESDDHHTLYIDKHVPKEITVDGKTFDPAKYLAVHESVERKYMDAGMKYEPAHRLALKAERKAVKADGISWQGYQTVMHRLAAFTQREKPSLSNPPRDLYEGPFRSDPKEEKTIEKEGVKHFAEGGAVEANDDDNSDEDEDTAEQGPWTEYQGAHEPGPWDDYKPESSAVGSFARGAVEGALPAAAGIPGAFAGAEAGAALGALGGPAAPLTVPLGGVLGGLAGAYGGAKIAGDVQDWFLDKLGLLDREQRAADEEQHPYARMAGNLAPNLLAFQPAKVASTLASRVIPGAIGAGLEGAQEASADQELDPVKMAMAAGAMALLNKPTKLGEALGGAGTRGAQAIMRRAGRPDMQPEQAPMKALPAPPDFTTSVEGETARYAGGDEQVFNEAAAPRGGTEAENARPVYEMPWDEYRDISTDGVATPDNEAPAAGSQPPPEKTAEFIAQSKSDAAPARNTNGTLGTAHEQPPPDHTVGTVGSNPDHPLSVGSERDYRATADSNVHPTSSGSTDHPSATQLDPARANISPEVEAALVGTENKAPVDETTPENQAPVGETAPPERTQLGTEVPTHPDTGIEQGAVTATVANLRAKGANRVADAIEQNPELEPQARRILQDLTIEPQEATPVDAEKARRARRLLERAQTDEERSAAETLMEEARNPLAKEQQEALATEQAGKNAARREAEGQVVKVADEGTVTTASQGKAKRAQQAAAAAQEAFEKFPPRDDISLEDRLRSALAHATEANFGVSPLEPPRTRAMPKGDVVTEGQAGEAFKAAPTKGGTIKKRTPAQEWLKAARDLVGTVQNPKTPRPAAIVKFLGDERMLRNGAKASEIREFNKVESDVALNKRKVTTDPIDSAIRDWTATLPDEERAAWEKEFGTAEHQRDEFSTEDWGERSAGKKASLDDYERRQDFWTNEDGKFNPQKFMMDLKGFFGPKNQAFAKTFAAKTTVSWRDQFARSLSDGLHAVRKMDDTNWLDREREASLQPDLIKKKAEDIYLARERDDIASLPKDVRDTYYKTLDPVLEDNDHLYDQIHQLHPGLLGDKVESHISRIPKGLHPDFGGDPVANVMATRRRGLKLSASQTMQREFMAIEDPQGRRTVVSPTNDGYREWNNYKSVARTNANFEPKVGTTFRDLNNNLMTVKDALTPEIEQHAMFKNGEKAQYYHNAVLSAYVTNAEMRGIRDHLLYLESLKPQLEKEKLGTTDAKKALEWAKEGEPWSKTVMPQMKDWYMHPRLREVMDDFAAPGLTTNEAWDKVRSMSEFTTKLLFINPLFHIANVGAHWFVAKGWDWVKPHEWRTEAVHAVNAIRSVLSQDSAIAGSPLGKQFGMNSPELRRFQDIIREHGGGTQFGGVLNQNRWNSIAKAAGETIASNPSKWDPIARVVDMSAPDLGRAIYRFSSKIMWAANDVFYTQLVMSKLGKGMSMPDAIRETEKHFPNYRVPSRVINDGWTGRFMSQALRDNTLFAFGPYHYGMFNSYAHIVKDAVRGTGEERTQAIGHMMALGLLAFAAYPLWDKAVQAITGNKDAEARRRGPMTLPYHMMRGLQGKEDLLNTVPSEIVTPSPLRTALTQLGSNRDFAGRPIVEPGDVSRIAKGPHRAQAAGRVAVQEASAAAKSLVAPYSIASRALESKTGGALAALRDQQILDVKNPSLAARRYEQQAAEIKRKGAETRARKGNRGWEENIYNRLTK